MLSAFYIPCRIVNVREERVVLSHVWATKQSASSPLELHRMVGETFKGVIT